MRQKMKILIPKSGYIMSKKMLHENQVIRTMIMKYCREKKVNYKNLKPKLKYHRSIIEESNCFIILDLMIDLGAQIGITEYRQWTKNLKSLFQADFKLDP